MLPPLPLLLRVKRDLLLDPALPTHQHRVHLPRVRSRDLRLGMVQADKDLQALLLANEETHAPLSREMRVHHILQDDLHILHEHL